MHINGPRLLKPMCSRVNYIFCIYINFVYIHIFCIYINSSWQNAPIQEVSAGVVTEEGRVYSAEMQRNTISTTSSSTYIGTSSPTSLTLDSFQPLNTLWLIFFTISPSSFSLPLFYVNNYKFLLNLIQKVWFFYSTQFFPLVLAAVYTSVSLLPSLIHTQIRNPHMNISLGSLFCVIGLFVRPCDSTTVFFLKN